MKDITVTAYHGFSKVAGETNLSTLISHVRSGAYSLSSGTAGRHRFPFFSLTGNYTDSRHPCHLLRYNPVVTMAVYCPAGEDPDVVRRFIESVPDVLACFLASGRRVFRVFVYHRSEYACRLRNMTFCVPAIMYSELEDHHARMCESVRDHMKSLLPLPVEMGSKDIGLGFFASCDPHAYLDRELLDEIPEITTVFIEKAHRRVPG